MLSNIANIHLQQLKYAPKTELCLSRFKSYADIIVCIDISFKFLTSCSSANLQISDCANQSKTNFFVTKEIKKSEIDNLSGNFEISLLKLARTRLIVHRINTSLTSNISIIQSVDGEILKNNFLLLLSCPFGQFSQGKVIWSCNNILSSRFQANLLIIHKFRGNRSTRYFGR